MHPAVHGNPAQAAKQPYSGRIPKKSSTLPLLLSPADAAEQLSLSRYTVYETLRRGELQGMRFVRLTRIHKDELERFARDLEKK